MAVRQYTVEQLLKLRESPLVSKPDNLPAIEQWIDDSQKQQQQRRVAAPTGDASPMGNFSAGQQRPGLVGARPTAVARSGEDVSLGPPRTVFASSRSTARLSDFPGDSTQPDESDTSRATKAFGDKQATRKTGTQEPDPRFSRESWTAAREKRITDGETAEDRNGRYARRDRENEGERRNGFGDRQDPRWTREAPRANGDRAGTWRRGEKPRQEREWDRSGHLDKEPEWMDDPAPKDEGDLSSLSMPKNQEDFEKWKQAQHARNKKSTDDSVSKVPEPPPLREPSPPPKPAATLKLDTLPSQSFHDWGKRVSTDGTPDSAATSAKPVALAKAKTSRFMPMFKKDEVKEEIPPPPVQTEAPNGSAEDKEGFQRILQMLGGTGGSQATPIAPPPQQVQQSQQSQQPAEPMSPQARQSGVDGKPKSRFTGFFDSVPRSPEALHSPPPPSRPQQHEMPHGGRPFTQEAGNVYSAKNHESQSSAFGGTLSPEPMPAPNGLRQQRPPSGQMNNVFLDNKPPSRGPATPDVNIQNLLASQRNQRQQEPDKNSQFLLNLLQAKGSSRPPSQQTQIEGNFPLWLDQPPNTGEPQVQKPRHLPPPGHLEEQLLRANSQGPPRPDSGHLPPNEILQRRTSQHRPGQAFYDEQALYLQQQQQQSRRGHAEPPHGHQISRRINTNLPPQMQTAPQLPGFQYPPEFLQSPGAQMSPHAHGPPPGFNGHMPRHPPGIHNAPQIFQAPHQTREQPPPGFGGPNGPPPPGFFAGPPPPGFMQMRSPTEIRGTGRGGMEGYDGMGQRR